MKELYKKTWDTTLKTLLPNLRDMVEQEHVNLKDGGFDGAQISEFAGRVVKVAESAWYKNLETCLRKFQEDSPRS
jgi:hypothetical protein